jgi:hypothetical protein
MLLKNCQRVQIDLRIGNDAMASSFKPQLNPTHTTEEPNYSQTTPYRTPGAFNTLGFLS